MSFRPTVNFQFQIDQKKYTFTEHPAAKGMPYGQTGRRATVYQVIDENQRKYALKVFTNAFRTSRIAEAAQRLQSFASAPGLNVCEREVLTPDRHKVLLEKYPDLTYAVLMPWVLGETWQEFVVSHRALPVDNAHVLAGQMTVLLAGMEHLGLAHCDIAGPNVMVDFSSLSSSVSTVVSALWLVDVEEMYGPGLTRPEKLPAGTPGYNHKVAEKGLWSADSDRFAGAVMLVEMLTRNDDRIRRISFQEQYFDPREMQQNTDRYRLAAHVLKEQGDTLAVDLFSRAWFSQTLSDCPTFSEWFVALNRPSQASQGAIGPVGGWRELGTPTARISTPPVVAVPVEKIRPMLQKAAAEGRWMDTLNLATQLLQVLPLDPESLALQTKSQRLIQLEQAVQSLWQAAMFSGTVEDWDNCIRTLTTTYYQAKNVTRYEQMLQDAEKERQMVVSALMLEQLINEKRWEEADAMRPDLPLDRPRIAELFARMDLEVSNQLRLAQLTRDAQKALDVRSWADAIRICQDGLILSINDIKLKELLDIAQKEMALDQRVAESLQLARQFSAGGQWKEAEKHLREAVRLQPQRQSLQEQLSDVIHKGQWAKKIKRAEAQINQESGETLLETLQDIPDGFANINEFRRLLHELDGWRTNLAIAQHNFDLVTVEHLLQSPLDKRVSVYDAEAWLKAEHERIASLEKAFQQMNAKVVEATAESLSQNHPLQMRCQTWLEDFRKTVTTLETARQVFDPELVQQVLAQLPTTFPHYSELTEWAKKVLETQKTLTDARAQRDMRAVEHLLKNLPVKHPVRISTEAWLQEEKSRLQEVHKARAAYDLGKLANLLSSISEEDVAFRDDWHWLKIQQQMTQNIEAAMVAFNVEQMTNFLKVIPANYPNRQEFISWLAQENDLRAHIRAAQAAYALEDVQKSADNLPEHHPLRAGLYSWLAEYWQLAADLNKARRDWDFERVLLLLGKVTKGYPDWETLSAWGIEMRELNRQGEALIANFDPDGLEKLLADWPQENLCLTNLRTALANMRQKQKTLSHLLVEAEKSLTAKDWQKAAQLCRTAMREPKISLRFGEIAEIARQELEKRKAAEKLILGAQEAVFQKRYAEAIRQADQAAGLLPNVQPYVSAGRAMREKLVNMAHAAEKNHKWNDAKTLWATLKSAPVAMSVGQANTTASQTTAISSNPTQPVVDVALQKAHVAFREGKFAEAVKWIRQADKHNSATHTLLNEMTGTLRIQAQAAQNAGKWERARDLWALLKEIK